MSNEQDQKNTGSKLKFVKEGNADLETQQLLEKRERARLDTDYKTKERLTLQDQLRLNAILKQEEFTALVKDRNSFNRLSVEDKQFYQDLQARARQSDQDMEEYLARQTRDFERKKSQVLGEAPTNPEVSPSPSTDSTSNIKVPAKIVKPKPRAKSGLKGIVTKKKSAKELPSHHLKLLRCYLSFSYS
ncbi:LADA_0D08108g1_1 [Lachancea dasiensis]|uniref:LADA_0D08108g1_1 n=1 Tax=Lachancea dasiensis TaxID=1072105 RepID=A0A1G4J7A5_9SACH|nr:LADA_0D08108g1_1 [Lachancea dasiensis]